MNIIFWRARVNWRAYVEPEWPNLNVLITHHTEIALSITQARTLNFWSCKGSQLSTYYHTIYGRHHTWKCLAKALGGTSFMCSLLGRYHIAVGIIKGIYHTWYLMWLDHSGSKPFICTPGWKLPLYIFLAYVYVRNGTATQGHSLMCIYIL